MGGKGIVSKKTFDGKFSSEFKKTDIGKIPIDWDLIQLKEIGSIVTGSTPDTKKSEYYNGQYMFISPGDINGSKYVNKTAKYLSVDGFKVSRILPSNSIMMTCIGSTIGKIAMTSQDCTTNQQVNSVIPTDDFDSHYVYYSLDFYFNKIKFRLIESQAVPIINKSKFSEIAIPFMKKPEQKKIAEILSTWDKAIELKEKLIEEKKKQKTGLMQRLLTGKLRLPGFHDEWEYKKSNLIFSNVSDKNHGGIGEVLSATQENGILPRSEIGIDIKFEKSSLSSYKRVIQGDFVISLRSFQGGIEFSMYEGLVSPAYTVLRNKLTISYSFYKNLFKSADFITKLNGLIYGIRDGKQIGYKDFSVLELPYPNLEEQEAIGIIADAADKEISLLEKELEALKLQKKGLMQLLLTGIVRVNKEQS